MGSGSYSYDTDVARKISNSNFSREEVFVQRTIHPDMKLCGQIRECRDSEEHPDTLPIIIGLDVTGSMGKIPHKLVTADFPKIMKGIMDAGIAHPQVCFVGIGDQYSDSAPLQVGQFEASDELLDHWLKTIWLESGGGGNGGESYQLAWWLAAAHTSIDRYTKRGKKGVLITIGDEPIHSSVTKREFEEIFGTKPEAGMATTQILAMAQEKWDVYHINLMDWSARFTKSSEVWTQLLGDHAINTEGGSGDDIPRIITGIILQSVGLSNNPNVTPAHASEAAQETPGNAQQHLR